MLGKPTRFRPSGPLTRLLSFARDFVRGFLALWGRRAEDDDEDTTCERCGLQHEPPCRLSVLPPYNPKYTMRVRRW